MSRTIKTTKIRTQKKLLEQALMLRIRWHVLMYQNRPSEGAKSRLLASIEALNLQVSTCGPSYWLQDNFVDQVSFFAGYWWAFTGEWGAYRVVLNDEPFDLNARVKRQPQLELVTC